MEVVGVDKFECEDRWVAGGSSPSDLSGSTAREVGGGVDCQSADEREEDGEGAVGKKSCEE